MIPVTKVGYSMPAVRPAFQGGSEVLRFLEDLGIEVVNRKKHRFDKSTDRDSYSEEWESTPDVSNSIRMYLSEMGKVPLLNREEVLKHMARLWQFDVYLESVDERSFSRLWSWALIAISLV